MLERHPVSYIRRSVASRADPGDLSRDFQIDAVRKLADGAPGLVILAGDWGRSAATDKTARRLAFLEMLESIERGEVTTVFAYSADRLARSVEWSARLLNACRRAGVTIVTNEGRFAPDDDAAIDLFNFRAVVNESVLRQMERKAQSAVAARGRRGDVMGRAPYGTRHEKRDGRIVATPDPAKPVAELVDAYNEAGSVFGAVRLLNQRHVPQPRGHYCVNGGKVPGCCHPKLNEKTDSLECSCGQWHATPLRHILERAGVPLPPPGPTGRRVPGRGSVLAQLVLCHCGHTMTPNNARNWLYCSKGQVNPKAHGRYYVNQRALMPIIRAEADRLSIPFDAVELGQQDIVARDGLRERKRRLALAFADGLLEPSDYAAELAKIAESVKRIEAAAEVVELPPLDWLGPVAGVNSTLRALFWPIQLRPDMSIAEIEWRVPEWRA